MKKLVKYMIILGTIAMMIAAFAETEAFGYETYRDYQNSYQTTTTRTATTPATTQPTTTPPTTTRTTTTQETTQETTQKVDTRVANYTGTTSDYREKTYKWTTVDGQYTFTIYLNMDYNVYSYYRSLDRYYDVGDYENYINDVYSKQAVELIASNLRDLQAQTGYSDAQIVAEAINFVQSVITYQHDEEGTGKIEHPKYPLETLFDKTGDCEDSAMLLAAIIEELGYGAVLLDYPGHVAVGILGGEGITGTYYNYNGGKYFYTETTAKGWRLGDMPEEYREMEVSIYTID